MICEYFWDLFGIIWYKRWIDKICRNCCAHIYCKIYLIIVFKLYVKQTKDDVKDLFARYYWAKKIEDQLFFLKSMLYFLNASSNLSQIFTSPNICQAFANKIIIWKKANRIFIFVLIALEIEWKSEQKISSARKKGSENIFARPWKCFSSLFAERLCIFVNWILKYITRIKSDLEWFDLLRILYIFLM